MLKVPIIDPSAPELSRSAHKLRVRRLGEIVLRAIDTTDQIGLICFILVDVASTSKEKKMPHRMDSIKTIFIFCEFF